MADFVPRPEVPALFLRACRRERVERTPVWMMRQAGRYLPQYRALRERFSFLQLCQTPELICEVTLQPIDEFAFDAAILFSDILIPLQAMGLGLKFTPAPVLSHPVTSRSDVDRLATPDPVAAMPFVFEGIRLICSRLAGLVPLIGFAGAPFTLAAYAVEGRGSKDFSKTRELMFRDPSSAHALLEKLADYQAAYLEAQVAAGAQAVQLFDSWAGVLSPRDFRDFALRYVRRVVDQLHSSTPWAKSPVPIIYFVNGWAPYLDDCRDSGADVLGVDWRIDLAAVRKRVGDDIAVQGNLDPACLFMAPDALRRRVADVLASAGDAPGHVFNLGHGVFPTTDPHRVRVMVEAVRELSAGG